MAEFGKNEELARQKKHIAPQKAKSKGFWGDAGDLYLNTLTAGADMVLSTVGGKDIIKDKAYRGKSGDKFRKGTDMGGHIMEGAGQVAATYFGGPAAGKLMGTLQGTVGGAVEGDLNEEDLGNLATDAISLKSGSQGIDSSTATKAMGGDNGSTNIFAGQATGKMGTAPNMDALKQFEENGGDVSAVKEAEKYAEANKTNSLQEKKKILDNIVGSEETATNPLEGGAKAKGIEGGAKGIDPATGQYIEAGVKTVGNILDQHQKNKAQTKEELSKFAELSQDRLWD